MRGVSFGLVFLQAISVLNQLLKLMKKSWKNFVKIYEKER